MDGDTVAFRIAGKASPKMIADRYEVRDRIGRGAFGEVFEVYDHRLKRLVALKTLPIDAVASVEGTEDLRRFYMEARAVARLSHPGIVTVHDFGETKDFAWIVMELVIGETLKAVLDRDERPSLAESVRVTCALLDALHYAHGRGIVHRDVKPANILLAMSAEDGLGEVRLADFGIARIGDAQQTVAGQVIGTPVAMSPEQVRGEETDLRSDLWSVGVILYQLLTGKRPFSGGMSAIFNSILTQNPPAPSLVMADLPSTLDEVIATALAKNPKDRYPDAAAMAAALRKAAAPWQTVGMVEDEDETVRIISPVLAATTVAAPVRRASMGGWALAFSFAAGALCGAFVTHQVLTRNGPAATAEVRMPDILPAEPLSLARAADTSPVDPPFVPTPALPARTEPEEPVPPVAIAAPLDEAPMAAEAGPEQTLPDPAEPSAAPSSLALAAAPELVPEAPAGHISTAPPVPAPSSPPAWATAPEPTPEVRPAQISAVPPLPIEPSALAPPPETLAAQTPSGDLPRCEPDRLASRSGNHPGFGRVVFDWTAPTRHEIRRVADGALLRFPGAGCLPSVERLAMPRNVLSIRPDEAGSGLRIATAPGSRLRLTRLEGNRVVVDALNGGE